MNFNRVKAQPASKTQNFLDSYLPTFIQVATLTVPIVYSLYERLYGYESLSQTVRSNLQSDNLSVREEAVNIILNDLATEKPNEKNELHYREHAAAAFDLGFYNILYKEVFGPRKSEQSEKFIFDSLQCMRKMLKAERDQEYIKRHIIMKKFGLKDLFQLCIEDHPFLGVTESALSLLRSLTRFDRFRRWTIEDIPNGSQGCVLLQYIEKDDWKKFLELFLTTNDTNILKSTTSIIAHASEYPKTAYLLNECGAIAQLVNHLRNPTDRLIGVKSVIAVSKIFESNPADNYSFLLSPKILGDIIRLTSQPEKMFYHPPDEITEHSVLLVIFTMAKVLLSRGTEADREEFTKILCQNQRQMATIFMLAESTKQSSVKQLQQFNEMIENPAWSSNHKSLIRIRDSAMVELEEARYKYQQMMKKRRQQQMQQMGGMGFPMMG